MGLAEDARRETVSAIEPATGLDTSPLLPVGQASPRTLTPAHASGVIHTMARDPPSSHDADCAERGRREQR